MKKLTGLLVILILHSIALSQTAPKTTNILAGRLYDSTTDTLWIWGEDPVVVGPVITAVRDLQAQVAAFRQRLFVTKS